MRLSVRKVIDMGLGAGLRATVEALEAIIESRSIR